MGHSRQFGRRSGAVPGCLPGGLEVDVANDRAPTCSPIIDVRNFELSHLAALDCE